MKKFNSLQDPCLERAILGRKRVHVHRITGVPVSESVEFRIMQVKKELGKELKAPKYQFSFFGEWKDITVDEYRKYLALGMKVRII